MMALFLVYFIYLLLYGLVSYAILFHLVRFRIEGDQSTRVMTIYIGLSIFIILGSIFFLRPV